MITLAGNSTIWPITNSTSADNVTLITPSYNTTETTVSKIIRIIESVANRYYILQIKSLLNGNSCR
jgi:hypothetical protein